MKSGAQTQILYLRLGAFMTSHRYVRNDLLSNMHDKKCLSEWMFEVVLAQGLSESCYECIARHPLNINPISRE